MEENLKKYIGFLRSKFNNQGLDVEKFIALIRRDKLLPFDNLASIEKEKNSEKKLDKFINELVIANDKSYQGLLSAIEQCVPNNSSPSFPSKHYVRIGENNTANCSGKCFGYFHIIIEILFA